MNNLIELLNKYKKIYSLKEKIEFIIDNLLNKIGKFSLKMKKIKNRK